MSFPRFSLRGFLRPRQVARLSLGELERRAMEAVWQKQELSVRDLFEELQKRWAYTTLMTTLDRLHKKGILNRRKEGRAFLYSPRISRKPRAMICRSTSSTSTAVNRRSLSPPQESHC